MGFPPFLCVAFSFGSVIHVREGRIFKVKYKPVFQVGGNDRFFRLKMELYGECSQTVVGKERVSNESDLFCKRKEKSGAQPRRKALSGYVLTHTVHVIAFCDLF